MTQTSQEHLRLALESIDIERAALDHRRSLIIEAMGEHPRETIEEVPAKNGWQSKDDQPEVTTLSISQQRLDAVRNYLEVHGEARQADIARDLNLNRGTVSVALRMLNAEGLAKPGPQREGSRVWERVRVIAHR